MRRSLVALASALCLAAVATVALSSSAETPESRPARQSETARRWPPPAPAQPRVELTDDGLQPLPTFAQGGRRFVLGTLGQRYRIHVVNPTGSRVEAVVSVDGLDAIDGRPASLAKRGYVIPAFGDVTIDGWRTSLDTVAAFRFSSVRDSYAGRKEQDRNVGVVGVAFFRERPPVVVRPSPAWRNAAPSADKAEAGGGAGAPAATPSRSGLGTQFGETRDSRVEQTTFARADASPAALSELRYDDRDGLMARGIDVRLPGERAENDRRDSARPFPGSRFAEPPR